MSSALLADPTYGERFLREARIAAKLRHPHVVGIHDVGREGDHFFIAMEYVSGGRALSADGHARDVALGPARGARGGVGPALRPPRASCTAT